MSTLSTWKNFTTSYLAIGKWVEWCSHLWEVVIADRVMPTEETTFSMDVKTEKSAKDGHFASE